MALTSTMFRLSVNLSDVDREVYTELDLRIARHPSETAEYMVTRALAFCLEWQEGIAFGRGVCAPEEAALAVTDPTGLVQLWVEIGNPGADRLHKATKLAPEVVVYVHKNVEIFLAERAAAPIPRQERLRVVAPPASLIAELARRTERNTRWEVLRNSGVLYVTVDGTTLEGELLERRWGRD
ncbi:MAG: YaeQ family protein [Myxococcales bacterium]|nr:YaeQ family protein [Myxococcales bacterium]MCB9520143.1 YaeQ family protein [Myxococcales bacterium]MCB9531235.1 YaeQ family protein [Myxococcales bacterium]MCB9534312.1 YaeQ family protein [Myxococcales bacterium]